SLADAVCGRSGMRDPRSWVRQAGSGNGTYNSDVRVLLVSTYDMGRQPFGLASPAAWLREAGADVGCVDLTREKLQDDEIRKADVVGFFLPMHTATRLALPVI